MTSIVFGFQSHESTIDFPGHITQMLFTSGCNFRCSYCHNQALWEKNKKCLSFSRLDEILQQANNNWSDAVCISGGEPTIHPELADLITYIKKKGFLIKLDTNGSRPDVLENLANHVDYIAMDIKAPFSDYQKFIRTPVDIQALEQSVDLIINRFRDGEFRTTVIEGIHKLEQAEQICRHIKTAKRYSIQPFVPQAELLDHNFTRISRTKKDFLTAWMDLCKKHLPGTEVKIRI